MPTSKLHSIDINELLYHFSHKSDSIAINRLRSGGVTSLGQLLDTQEEELSSIPYIGASTLHKVYVYKMWLRENHDLVLREAAVMMGDRIVPSDYSPARESLLQAVHRALSETARLLEERIGNPRFASSARELASMRFLVDILTLRYDGHMSFAAIAAKTGRTAWHVTKTHFDFLAAMLAGRAVAVNILMDKRLIHSLQDLAANGICRPCPLLEDADSDTDESILGAIGIGMLEIVDGLRIPVQAGLKCKFSAKAKAVMRLLRRTIAPMPRIDAERELSEMTEFSDNPHPDDDIFVNSLLSHPLLTEGDREKEVKLHHSQLQSDEQRVARIIIDNNGWLTRSQVADRFRSIYRRDPHIVNLSNLKKYGVNSSGDLWNWGLSLPPISHFVADFAEEHKIFYLAELETEMKKQGYPILSRVRSYITTSCLVDNLDSNHFCHKSHVADYPWFNWRRPGRSGLTNWILNSLNNLLENSDCISIDEAMEQIERCAAHEGGDKTTYIRSRIKTTINSYSGEDKPFHVDANGCLRRNPRVHPLIDFRTIGRRGHEKTAGFAELRKMALEVLGQQEDQRISLVDLIKDINSRCDTNHTRNTVVRALTNSYMDAIPLALRNIDGTVYVTRPLDETEGTC